MKHAEMRGHDTGIVRFADEKDAELAISECLLLLFRSLCTLVGTEHSMVEFGYMNYAICDEKHLYNSLISESEVGFSNIVLL